MVAEKHGVITLRKYFANFYVKEITSMVKIHILNVHRFIAMSTYKHKFKTFTLERRKKITQLGALECNLHTIRS